MIYVPQEPRPGPNIDLTPLHRSGEFTFVFPMNHSPSFDPFAAVSMAGVALRSFDFETDSVAVAGGDPMATLIVGSVLATMASELGVRGFNYLRFERGRGSMPSRYSPVRIPFA